MENEKQAFAARLKAAFTQAGYPLKPTLLSREFNLRYWGRPVSVQAMCKWLDGNAIPAQDKLLALAEWLKVRPHVLRYGAEAALKVEEDLWWEAVSYQEREMFEQILALPAEKRRIIREIVTAFLHAQADTP